MHGRFQIPEPWPYQEARRLFKEPLVTAIEELPEFKWNIPDEEVKTCLALLWPQPCHEVSLKLFLYIYLFININD